MDLRAFGGIDCDVHPTLPGTSVLLPYLDAHWQHVLTMREIDRLELNSYPPNAPLTARPDWKPEGGRAGVDCAALCRDTLDHFGLRHAILNCLTGVQVVYNEHIGAALCRAVNQWIAAEWLDSDARLRASIVVSPTNPDTAAEEIERAGADKRFVQILLLAQNEMPLGRRYYWPIYRAAERLGLPIGIHAGSMMRHPPTQSGYPSTLVEDYIGQTQGFAAQLISLVAEGVFAQFPSLRVVLMESGVSWLPGLMWRMSKDWRGIRTEVPWVKNTPAHVLREHVRLTVTPFDAPPDDADLGRVIDQMGSEDMLLFSTDYPHWQFDGDDVLPAGLPEALLRKIMVDNARATYPRLNVPHFAEVTP